MPEVSVVIPTIEFDSHLKLAMESVLSQTDVDLELVLVLDGAGLPENSSELSDARIVVVQIPSRSGTPNALNVGLRNSTSNLVARLDADDLALPGRLRKQIDFMQQNPEVLCAGSDVALIDNDGAAYGTLKNPSSTDDLRETLLSRNCFAHSSVIYRRDEILKLGGYSPMMKRMQDYELFLRVAELGEIASIGEVLTAYRIHPNQHSMLTSPWQPYTKQILRKRLDLAKSMGKGQFAQHFRNVIWFAAQVARYAGLINPGHHRRARAS